MDVGMVQDGNETIHGLFGETENENICTLMKSGSNAIRAIAASEGKEILIALYFTNVQDAGFYDSIAEMLDANMVRILLYSRVLFLFIGKCSKCGGVLFFCLSIFL